MSVIGMAAIELACTFSLQLVLCCLDERELTRALNASSKIDPTGRSSLPPCQSFQRLDKVIENELKDTVKAFV